ncbi:hypothetical protein ACQV2T_09105 [Facklamia sp. P13069]|uniref:hypothetical protein n=1 Tax=Facklamia sp. P13069 TaxID=3421954 RepID=UPI003D17D5EC
MFQIKSKNKVISPKIKDLEDGKKLLSFDFSPTSADQSIELIHEDVLDGSAYGHIGDYYLEQTMLWTGDPNKPYEKNTSEASRLRTIFDNLNNISLAMRDPANGYGKFQINANGILTEFLNADGSLKTSTLTTAGKIINLIQGETSKTVQQMSEDIYNVTVSKEDIINEINVQAGSTIFSSKNSSGKNVLRITPETTYIQDATIKSSMIADAAINTAKIGTIDALTANIININAKNITGQEANLIQAMFNGKHSMTKIDSNGMKVLKTIGSNEISTEFVADGIRVYGNRNNVNKWIGALSYSAGGDFALAGKSGANLILGYSTGADNSYLQSLAVHGSLGDVRLYRPILHGDRPQGFRLDNYYNDTVIEDVMSGGAIRWKYSNGSDKGYFYIYEPTSNKWICINTNLQNLASRLANLERTVKTLQSSIRNIDSGANTGGTVNPGSSDTGGETGSGSKIYVGAKIKLNSSTIYNQDGYRLTVDPAYRNLTYKVLYKATWNTPAPYRCHRVYNDGSVETSYSEFWVNDDIAYVVN